MKRHSICILFILCTLSAGAWEYNREGATTDHNVQTRVGFEFSKKWNCGVALHVSEELRFSLYDHETGTNAKSEAVDSTSGASFNRSYTTLSLSYSPIQYVKFDAGYTFRLLGSKDWSDANEFLRHRVFFGVTGSYKTTYAKIYIRERALVDMRTDSVNTAEKNRNNWLLRSRIGTDFLIPGKPVKPYAWVELENTLNAPEYQQKNGQQFISRVRTQAGVKWRVSRLSSLDFYYRFTYGYDRDINITKNKGNIELTEETLYQHSFGVSYHIDL